MGVSDYAFTIDRGWRCYLILSTSLIIPFQVHAGLFCGAYMMSVVYVGDRLLLMRLATEDLRLFVLVSNPEAPMGFLL